MNTHPSRSLMLSLSVAGLLAFSLAGCDRPQSSTGAPPPARTVGTAIDDSVVTTRVRSALLADPQIKSFDFKLETRKGEVMLSGFVDNQAQLDQALAVTRGVEGVASVDNKVALKTSAATIGNKVDDVVVTARVKAALLADALIKSLDITVVTNKGEVQLSGFVDNQGQMERVAEVTRGVEGVGNVSNQMSMKK